MAVREEVVRALMHGALEGMHPVVGTYGASANEVFSAHFTMLRGAIKAAKEMGVPNEALRDGVEKIWFEVAPDTVQ